MYNAYHRQDEGVDEDEGIGNDILSEGKDALTSPYAGSPDTSIGMSSLIWGGGAFKLPI